QHYRCEVLEETETQSRVRLSEENARELRFTTELWLPKSYIKIGDETLAGGDENGNWLSG
ncbi:MAG TPA: hypothetical protein VF766_14340, partial [Pyrinomonadaceae bacterium]